MFGSGSTSSPKRRKIWQTAKPKCVCLVLWELSGTSEQTVGVLTSQNSGKKKKKEYKDLETLWGEVVCKSLRVGLGLKHVNNQKILSSVHFQTDLPRVFCSQPSPMAQYAFWVCKDFLNSWETFCFLCTFRSLIFKVLLIKSSPFGETVWKIGLAKWGRHLSEQPPLRCFLYVCLYWCLPREPKDCGHLTITLVCACTSHFILSPLLLLQYPLLFQEGVPLDVGAYL